jgi:hypothetical protein
VAFTPISRSPVIGPKAGMRDQHVCVPRLIAYHARLRPQHERSATARTRAMAVQQEQSMPLRYVELPDLRETFADSVHTMVSDGQTLRIEFCVTRYPALADAGVIGKTPPQQPDSA